MSASTATVTWPLFWTAWRLGVAAMNGASRSKSRLPGIFAPGGASRQTHEVQTPETRFGTAADGVQLAYQVVGTGDVDIVLQAAGNRLIDLRIRHVPRRHSSVA